MATLYNPTGRNTQAHIASIGGTDYYFSYRTCIAFRGYLNGSPISARLPNNWGPTTGRHFNEMGCGGFPVYDEDAFAETLHKLEVGK